VCAERQTASWWTNAAAACYEVDEGPDGCLAATCGSLAAIAASDGADSRAYFEALLCRQDMLEGGFGSFSSKGTCQAQYHACVLDCMYATWLATRAQGGCSLAGPQSYEGLEDLPAAAALPPAPVTVTEVGGRG
jgi:hypothetical protein